MEKDYGNNTPSYPGNVCMTDTSKSSHLKDHNTFMHIPRPLYLSLKFYWGHITLNVYEFLNQIKLCINKILKSAIHTLNLCKCTQVYATCG